MWFMSMTSRKHPIVLGVFFPTDYHEDIDVMTLDDEISTRY
jgi:hypothetical protein